MVQRTGKRIKLSDGGGGQAMQRLLSESVIGNLKNVKTRGGIGLEAMDDAAVIKVGGENLVFTTDSYVVDPVFFKGGDIGKLAMCGTINDLAVMGAKPIAVSCALIISEGFPIKDVERIMRSMNHVSQGLDVPIVTGDTKVVGAATGIYINTAGIGIAENVIRDSGLAPGDKIIVSGTLGDHGMAILSKREGLEFEADIKSDCAAVYPMIKELLDAGIVIHAAKDPTRGGFSNAINEMAEKSGVCVEIDEDKIPINPAVKSSSEMLGIDPLEVANEGKVVLGIPEKQAKKALDIMRKNLLGRDSAVVGRVVSGSRVVLNTVIGGRRILEKPMGDPVPRVC